MADIKLLLVEDDENLAYMEKIWLRCGSPWIAHQAC